jgi:hypothetical protein
MLNLLIFKTSVNRNYVCLRGIEWITVGKGTFRNAPEIYTKNLYLNFSRQDSSIFVIICIFFKSKYNHVINYTDNHHGIIGYLDENM